MSTRGVFRLILSSSALLGAGVCLWMVSLSWDQAQERIVRQLSDAAAAEKVPHLVVIDAGHGGMDGGTQGFGQLEKDISLDLAQRLGAQLRNAGCEIVMTRQDDTLLSLEERSEVANRAGASVFVSLHLNADAKSADTHGIETYYSSRKKLGSVGAVRETMGLRHDIPIVDTRSEWLARIVHSRLCRTTGAPDRLVRDSQFVVVMLAECPAILVECGYLTNQAESLCFTDEGYKDSVATAVAKGVLHYLQAIKMNPRRGLRFEPPPGSLDEPAPDPDPGSAPVPPAVPPTAPAPAPVSDPAPAPAPAPKSPSGPPPSVAMQASRGPVSRTL